MKMWKKIKMWWRQKQDLRQLKKDLKFRAKKAKEFGKWVGSQDPSKFIGQSASPRNINMRIIGADNSEVCGTKSENAVTGGRRAHIEILGEFDEKTKQERENLENKNEL
jgi:hypothetical protein